MPSSMFRPFLISSATVLVFSSLLACATEVPEYREPPEGLDEALRNQFKTEVQPLLGSLCGSCHDNGGIGPQFMATDAAHKTMYEQVKGWSTPAGQDLVDLEDVGASYLLGKGDHNGARGFNDPESASIRAWLNAEFDAVETAEFVQTDALDLDFNINDIDLGDVGLPGLAGTRLRFSYETSNTLIYVRDLTLIAGPEGLRVEEPVVVPILDGVPVLEPTNRFAEFEAELAPGELIVLDSGLSPYVQLADVYTPSKTLRMAFFFRVLEPL